MARVYDDEALTVTDVSTGATRPYTDAEVSALTATRSARAEAARATAEERAVRDTLRAAIATLRESLGTLVGTPAVLAADGVSVVTPATDGVLTRLRASRDTLGGTIDGLTVQITDVAGQIAAAAAADKPALRAQRDALIAQRDEAKARRVAVIDQLQTAAVLTDLARVVRDVVRLDLRAL